MNAINFHISADGLTFGMLAAMEEIRDNPAGTLRQQRDLLAGFLVDENGAPVPFKRAKEIINAIRLDELGQMWQVFNAEIERLKNSQSPPAIIEG